VVGPRQMKPFKSLTTSSDAGEGAANRTAAEPQNGSMYCSATKARPDDVGNSRLPRRMGKARSLFPPARNRFPLGARLRIASMAKFLLELVSLSRVAHVARSEVAGSDGRYSRERLANSSTEARMMRSSRHGSHEPACMRGHGVGTLEVASRTS